MDEEAHSDVIREAQKLVELAFKAMLRQAGLELPHWHDVGGLFPELADRFPDLDSADLDRIAAISTWLHAERESSFYGKLGLIAPKRHTEAVARRAFDDASWGVSTASRVIPEE